MDFEVGSVVTGKVTGITKFGAFVQLAPGKSGLVHISEIANSYVSDIHDHLTDGQDVTVKIIGIDDNNRINLSIKAAQPEPARPIRQDAPRRPVAAAAGRPRQAARSSSGSAGAAEPSFEDKLKRFMQDSDSKISDLKHNTDKKGSRRRGR